jgi:hypothetical protein
MTAHAWILIGEIDHDELSGGKGFRYKCTNCGLPVSVVSYIVKERTEEEVFSVINNSVEEENVNTCELWILKDVLV